MSGELTLGAPVSKGLSTFLAGPGEPDVYDEICPILPPYEHQRRAVNENISSLVEYGFRADFMEMGTGKTKVTFDTWQVLVARGLSDTLFVLAPKTLISTWAVEELGKHLSIHARVGWWDGKKTQKSAREFDQLSAWPDPLVYVINIEALQVRPINPELQRRVSYLMRKRRSFVAIDESSMVKSHDSNRSIAAKAICKLAPYRVILTGTEISKSPLDLFMQFEILNPGFWGLKSFFMFKSRYAILEDQYASGGRTFKKVTGYQKLDELMDRIRPFTTRALKKDCLDLPEKIHVTHKLKLTEAQEKAYAQLKKFMAMELEDGKVLTIANKIALFTKFRQITGGTLIDQDGKAEVIEKKPEKLQVLVDLVQDTDEQMIVWCTFSAEIDMVLEALSPFGDAVRYDGDTQQEERDRNKTAFQNGEARFFVGNQKAGAYGLNLQNCHVQALYSQDTSPQVNWQSYDRSHRPGQKYPCVYHHLVCEGTVDERIATLIDESKDLLDLLREGGSADILSLV